MRLAKVLMAAAAMTMTAAPAVAASRTASAAPSLAKAPQVRAATKAGKSKAVAPAFLIALLAIVPLGFAVYTAADGEPDSD
ncbi:hypothetical protein SAMN06297144_1697 [Sphingomonas guangdongensis]|uniref:Uncharacterized protein n=2 Tax=Sphingomonas guangdongensis TaxID=1141890 RepID=A0A285QX95_9SPHN|nr:hypothetical protein SAMN06297144_1697 [Sphingomonas guangdongensis]